MAKNEANLDFSQRELIVQMVTEKLLSEWHEGLQALRFYDDHPSDDLKRDLLALTWRFALNSNNSTVRQELVKYQLEVATRGSSFLAGQAFKFLSDFSPADFDEFALDMLSALPWSGNYGAEIIRLIGVADVRVRASDLKETASTDWIISDSTALYGSRPWSAALVLARFGDADSIQLVIAQVKNEPDIIQRATHLFKDLAYTKQQLAFDSLRDYLHSTERLPQVKNTVLGRPEAIYAAEQFSLYVEDCPVTDPDVKEKDIAMIREWAGEQTMWKIRD